MTAIDGNTVTPINLTTMTAGAPITVGTAGSRLTGVAVTPDGSTVYVANENDSTVTPINTATNTAGTPIPLPVGASPMGIAIAGSSTSPPTGVVPTCTGASPSDVANQTAGSARAVHVTWTAPQPVSCGVLGHYNIVVINAKGQPGQVVATAPADSTSATISGTSLNLCTWYRLGVQSVLTSGQESPVKLPVRPAFVSGPPDKVPPAIFLIVTGTSTSGPADQFDPAHADFCTSPEGVLPSTNSGYPALQNLANSWLNVGDQHPDAKTSGAGNNLSTAWLPLAVTSCRTPTGAST